MRKFSISFVFIFWTIFLSSDELTIRNSIEKILPKGSQIESIQESSIAGLYAVYYGDLEPIYVSEDGNFFIYGNIFKINKNSILNITDIEISKRRSLILSNLVSSELISFKSSNEKHVVTVFTDVDCGYCRKLHNQIKEYNKLGITINYAAFPRSGLGSDSFMKMVGAWCSENMKLSLTKLKNNKEVSVNFCDNQPVSKHYAIGNKLGVTGTPAIFSSDGRLFPGYLSPEDLLIKLES
ncbi:MAG: thioredoxin [Flavobacteriales bacterium]|nr:thioredoxin [Flavobacteriales bacterium]